MLIGCHQEKKQTIKKEKKEPEIVVEETVEYVETDILKSLVRKTSAKTEIVEIMILHDRMFEQIKEAVDLDVDLKLQDELIDEIVLDELKLWKKEIVLEVLEDENVTLNDDDLETLIARTSINDAYDVMRIFEKAFLETMK